MIKKIKRINKERRRGCIFLPLKVFVISISLYFLLNPKLLW